jgi:hypothetical protein
MFFCFETFVLQAEQAQHVHATLDVVRQPVNQLVDPHLRGRRAGVARDVGLERLLQCAAQHDAVRAATREQQLEQLRQADHRRWRELPSLAHHDWPDQLLHGLATLSISPLLHGRADGRPAHKRRSASAGPLRVRARHRGP